jgi:hypothetical protein
MRRCPMADDNPFNAKKPDLSPEDQEVLRKHVRINKGGGILELEPGDAVVVFRHDKDVTCMPDVVIPQEGGTDSVARVNACKVLFVLAQLNDQKSLAQFGEYMEEAYADFKETISQEDLDGVVKYESLTPGFISPGSDEVH